MTPDGIIHLRTQFGEHDISSLLVDLPELILYTCSNGWVYFLLRYDRYDSCRWGLYPNITLFKVAYGK